MALLVSFGGPTVRFVSDDESACEMRVEVSWWGDRAECTMVSELAGVLWEIADERAGEVAR